MFHVQILQVHTSENMNWITESRIMYGVKSRGLGTKHGNKRTTCTTHFVMNYLGYQGGISEIELRNEWQDNEDEEERGYVADN